MFNVEQRVALFLANFFTILDHFSKLSVPLASIILKNLQIWPKKWRKALFNLPSNTFLNFTMGTLKPEFWVPTLSSSMYYLSTECLVHLPTISIWYVVFYDQQLIIITSYRVRVHYQMFSKKGELDKLTYLTGHKNWKKIVK